MGTIAKLSATLGACALALTAMSAPVVAAAPNNELAARRTLEADVLQRINFARQFPREYAQQLRQYRSYIGKDGILWLPGLDHGYYTYEGRASVDEAIAFLERQAPLPALSEGQILALAARDHADDQGRDGAEGHISADGSEPGDRAKRRGGDIYVAEGISYGMFDADAVVRQLIVDDGVPDRGHRNLLFDREYRFAGVGCGQHRTLQYLCVVDLAGTPDGAPLIPEWAQARGAKTFVYQPNGAPEGY